MKILVDNLPKTCGDCEFRAPAMLMTPLGVEKKVDLCTLRMTLVPVLDPSQEPPTLDLAKSPLENGCLCKGQNDPDVIDVEATEVQEEKKAKKSSIILD